MAHFAEGWERMSRIGKILLGVALLLGSLGWLPSREAQAASDYVVAPQIATGYYHTLALHTNGTVYSWGQNTKGQLGNGSTIGRMAPIIVSGLSGVKEVAAGIRSSYALKEDGTLWAWGMNENGQLGDGTTDNRSLPVQITGIDGSIAAMSSGVGYHMLAATDRGEVWAWGLNTSGELGLGSGDTSTQKNVPVRVPGLTDVVAVAAGGWHSLALKADGTVWAWGNNEFGSLGDGTLTNGNVPKKVGIEDVVAISAGNSHSLAVKADGTVWSWGYNAWGMLGDGTAYNRREPVRALGVTDAVAVVGGGHHSYALTRSGTVWTWGLNNNGEMGDGTGVWRYTPVINETLSNVIAVTAGGFNGFAMQRDGTIWGWGSNSSGELGDNTLLTRNVPVVNKAVVDLTPPAVSDPAISVSDLSNTSLTLSWTQATDNLTAPEELQYRVYRVGSSTADTVAAVEAGTPIGPYEPDLSGKSISGLYGGQAYSFAVVVQDKAGKKSLYPKIRVRTLDDPMFYVTYVGNHNTGGIAPLDSYGYFEGEWAEALGNDGGLAREGFAFEGWNTMANGRGTDYAPGDTIVMSADVTLFAKWADISGPVVQSYFPDRGATGVPAHAPLSMEFNEVVTAVQGKTIAVSKIDGSWSETFDVADPSKVTVAGSLIAFRPSVPLDPSATYAVRIDPGSFVDDSGNPYAGIENDSTWRFRVASGNATLDSLALTDGGGVPILMNPAFSSNRTNYSAGVANEVSAIRVTAGASDNRASVTATVYGNAGTVVQGPIALASGVPSGSLQLEVGYNRIELETTAENGDANTYYVIVDRETAPVDPGHSSDATLDSLALTDGGGVPILMNPAFSSNRTNYSAGVANGVSAIRVTAGASDNRASVTATVYGNAGTVVQGPIALASGTPSGPLPLEVGYNRIELKVTAENGDAKTYKVEASRSAAPASTGSDTSNPGKADPNPPAAHEPKLEAKVGSKLITSEMTVRRESSPPGRTRLTASFDSGKLLAQLAQAPANPRLAVEGDKSETDIAVELSAKVIRELASRGTILEIRAPYGAYELPLAALDEKTLGRVLGSESSDQATITVAISLAETKGTGDTGIVGTPVAFSVQIANGGKSQEIEIFGAYANRILPLPKGAKADEIATVAVLEPDGAFRHVPTRFEEANGQSYAVAGSRTNSVYALVRRAPVAFADVNGHWAQADAADMASRLVMQGAGDGRFRPAAPVTRAEFAVTLVRALGLPERGAKPAFSDVPADAWYAGAVASAAEFGLVSGDAAGRFRPSGAISREEAAVLIARAMSLTGLGQGKEGPALPETETLAKYRDSADVSGWARRAVAAAVSEGLLRGDRSSALSPQGTVTRAETAAIVRRLLQRSGLID